MTGCFITIEGGEGAGKSTLISGISAWLEKQGIAYQITREPGGTPMAEAIRQLLLHDSDSGMLPVAELLLMFAARYQHIHERIVPALDAGQVVVCDRFTDSSYAYQGVGREIGIDKVAQLEQLVHPDLQPDLTLLLDLPVTVGQQRKCGDRLDRIEQASTDFFERVRKGYLERAAECSERFTVLNAGLSPDNVLRDALSAIKSKLKHAVKP